MITGHFYFLKPQYFDDFPNSKFMSNHQETDTREHKRPCFCAFTENDKVFWLIPISSKVDKFEKVYADKVERYGKCDTNPVQLCDKVRKRIIHKAKRVLVLQRKGVDLLFGNVLDIEKELLK